MTAAVRHGVRTRRPGRAVTLAVVAAHRRGQPLHGELLTLGARFLRVDRTAPVYRLLALDGPGVARGGLVRVAEGGDAVEVELFELAVGAVGELAVALPAPLAVGRVALATESVVGIVCDSAATGRDITAHGSWPAYLRRIMEP
jgi:allophanate hydrolase